MLEKDYRNQLEAEGFSHVFVWQDGPDVYYADHTHADRTAHIVLEGEITLSAGGLSQTYRVGERCDIDGGAVHSARTGPRGCRYLIGQ